MIPVNSSEKKKYINKRLQSCPLVWDPLQSMANIKNTSQVITSGLRAAAGKTPPDPHSAFKCWCDVALIAVCCLLKQLESHTYRGGQSVLLQSTLTHI